MKDIIIIGAGGVGKEVAFLIEEVNIKRQEWNILGFIDDNNELLGKNINGYKVLGGLKSLINFELSQNKPYIVIAIANYGIKKKIVKELNGIFNFATIIHPNVIMPISTKVGVGSIIYPMVIITTNVVIGEHVIISPKCGIGHESIIEDYASLLWNVNISGNDTIKKGALIGSGTTVIQGKVVGEGAVLGAGSIVIKDIKKNTTNVGVPSREIKN